MHANSRRVRFYSSLEIVLRWYFTSDIDLEIQWLFKKLMPEKLICGKKYNCRWRWKWRDPFDAEEAGFDLSFKFYVRKYVVDPNAREDTIALALNTGTFWFIIALDVAKHIWHIRTIFQYLLKLPGDIVTNDAQICHWWWSPFQSASNNHSWEEAQNNTTMQHTEHNPATHDNQTGNWSKGYTVEKKQEKHK